MNTEKMSHVVSMRANVGVLIGLSLLVYELNLNNHHLQEQAETVALQARIETIRSVVLIQQEHPEYLKWMFIKYDENSLSRSVQIFIGAMVSSHLAALVFFFYTRHHPREV